MSFPTQYLIIRRLEKLKKTYFATMIRRILTYLKLMKKEQNVKVNHETRDDMNGIVRRLQLWMVV